MAPPENAAESLGQLSQSISTYALAVAIATLFVIVNEGDFQISGIKIPPAYLATYFFGVTSLLGYQIARLTALIEQALQDATDPESVRHTLRSHTALLNVFVETRGRGKLLLETTPCVFAVTACYLPFGTGIITFYRDLLPAILASHSVPGIFWALQYFVGQGFLILAVVFFLVGIDRLLRLVKSVGSTEATAKRKHLAITLTGFILTVTGSATAIAFWMRAF